MPEPLRVRARDPASNVIWLAAPTDTAAHASQACGVSDAEFGAECLPLLKLCPGYCALCERGPHGRG